MIFALPWALLGLLSLPALWWLHRRLARPPRVDLPSLLFFVEEPGPVLATARRRRDLELALALFAAACLSVAAAGPETSAGTPGRLVRVVIAGGAPAGQSRYDERVEAEIARMRAALAPADRLDVVAWPGDGARPSRHGPRPSPSALAGAALAGAPGLAVVISDALPSEVPADVRWVAVGDAKVANLGIVAVDVAPEGSSHLLLVTLANHARASTKVWLGFWGDAKTPPVELQLAPDEVRSVVTTLPAGGPFIGIRVDGGDALSEDDAIQVWRRPQRWGIDLRLPAAHRAAVRAGLQAVLGSEAVAEVPAGAPGIDIWVLPSTDAWADLNPLPPALLLGVMEAGTSGVRVPGAQGRLQPGTLTEDLSLAGVDLVHPPEPLRYGPTFRPYGRYDVMAWQESPERTWPILVRTNDRVVVVPDVTRGFPPPTTTSFWPVLVENVVGELAGAVGPSGLRREGLLDLASTRLGREARPFDPDWLLAAPADRGPEPRRLASWFAGLAVAALLALWMLGVRRAPAREVPGALQLAVAR